VSRWDPGTIANEMADLTKSQRFMTESIDKLCFPEGKEVALTAARAAGKSLLTMANLNTLTKDQQANKALAAEAAKDLPGFLSQHFYFTPAQQQQVKSLSASSKSQLAKGLQMVATNGGSIQFDNPVATPDGHKSGHVKFTTPLGSFEASWDNT